MWSPRHAGRAAVPTVRTLTSSAQARDGPAPILGHLYTPLPTRIPVPSDTSPASSPYTRVALPPISTNKDAVKTDIREGDRSTIVLEVELTAQELQRAIDEGVRHLARRTRVPGFRPGKAPRPILERALGIDRSDPDAPNPIYDEAREHLYERTVLQALRGGRPGRPGAARASPSGRASRRARARPTA